MANEFTKYQKEWDRYKDVQADGCIIAILIGLGGGGYLILSNSFPVYKEYFKTFAILTVGVLILISITINFTRYNSSRMCPRCKNNFGESATSDRCQHCELPLYYGSSYFLDFWGSEQCKQFAKEIEENNVGD